MMCDGSNISIPMPPFNMHGGSDHCDALYPLILQNQVATLAMANDAL